VTVQPKPLTTAQVTLPGNFAANQLTVVGNSPASLMIVTIPGIATYFIPLGVNVDQNALLAIIGKLVTDVNNLGGLVTRDQTTAVALNQQLNPPAALASNTSSASSKVGLMDLSPMSPPTQAPVTGPIQIEGNYSQSAKGTLGIAIGGLTFIEGGTTQYDRLQVSGSATLAGTLALLPVDPTGGTHPAPVAAGSQFDVVVARSIQVDGLSLAGPVDGTFQVLNLPDGRQALRVTVAPTAPKLAITQQGNSVVISYPTSAAGYSLESTTDLVSGLWSPAAAVNGTLTITPSQKRQFFRLKK